MTAGKRALLVGSSFSAAPLYFELKRRNLDVTVCGSIKADPCHQYADNSVYVDYSDRQKLLQVAIDGEFDYLIPSCNDYSYLSSCWVADQLGFPGFDKLETTEILHSKEKFREFTEINQIKAPRRYFNSTGSPSELPVPALVKPIDAFSGRGVTKVEHQDELDPAILSAQSSSRSGGFVVEEYVEGRLHSHSAFISEGRIALDFFADEFCTVYPYQVNCSNHPSDLSDEIRNAVRSEMNKLTAILQLRDGLIHTQFISDGDSFWIIECMRRCPGDLYGHLIERSTGINYSHLFVAPFLGEGFPATESGKDKGIRPYGRHTVSTNEELVYFSFEHSLTGSDVEIFQLKSSGEVLLPAPHDKLAILIFQFPSADLMFAESPNLADRVTVNCLGVTDDTS